MKGKAMRKSILASMVLASVMGLVFMGCGSKDADKPAPAAGDQKKEPEKAAEKAAEKPGIVQAEPVWALFVSVRDNKIEDFKKVWTKDRSAEIEKEGWEGAFKEFGGDVKELLGDAFQLADFKFTFEGDDKKGKVKGTIKEKQLPKMNVECEDGKWLVSER